MSRKYNSFCIKTLAITAFNLKDISGTKANEVWLPTEKFKWDDCICLIGDKTRSGRKHVTLMEIPDE